MVAGHQLIITTIYSVFEENLPCMKIPRSPTVKRIVNRFSAYLHWRIKKAIESQSKGLNIKRKINLNLNK